MNCLVSDTVRANSIRELYLPMYIKYVDTWLKLFKMTDEEEITNLLIDLPKLQKYLSITIKGKMLS